MNKAELIDAVADAADISKAAAARSVDTVLEVITESLKGGKAVTLVGFGTFSTRAVACGLGHAGKALFSRMCNYDPFYLYFA